MNFMTCNTCRAVVNANPTGICLACQSGFSGVPSDDSYENDEYDQNTAKLVAKMNQRKQEVEDALSKLESKKMDVCQQTTDGKRMAKRNAKRQKAAKKSEED